jgi:hypothetical protein
MRGGEAGRAGTRIVGAPGIGPGAGGVGGIAPSGRTTSGCPSARAWIASCSRASAAVGAEATVAAARARRACRKAVWPANSTCAKAAQSASKRARAEVAPLA